MSDIDDDYDDDDESTTVADDETVQRIEVDLLTAIANDHEATFGYPVTVASYLLVTEVINDQGGVEMMWTTTDGMPPQAMLGLAHWLLKRVDEAT